MKPKESWSDRVAKKLAALDGQAHIARELAREQPDPGTPDDTIDRINRRIADLNLNAEIARQEALERELGEEEPRE